MCKRLQLAAPHSLYRIWQWSMAIQIVVKELLTASQIDPSDIWYLHVNLASSGCIKFYGIALIRCISDESIALRMFTVNTSIDIDFTATLTIATTVVLGPPKKLHSKSAIQHLTLPVRKLLRKKLSKRTCTFFNWNTQWHILWTEYNQVNFQYIVPLLVLVSLFSVFLKEMKFL